MDIGDVIGIVLEHGNKILGSPFALNILTLVLLVLLGLWTRRTIIRERHERDIALLECRADGIEDQGHIASLRSLCFEYRMLYVNAQGGKREVHPELLRVDHRFEGTRREIHDARALRLRRVKERVARVEESMKETDV